MRGLPSGQVGLLSAQLCTISLGDVRLTYCPFTPPPNRLYSVSGFAADTAGARVHSGMRFSFVSRSNRSSAAAMKFASAFTDVVFTFAAAFFAGAADPDAEGLAEAVEAEVPEGAGVPWRDGCALVETCRSFPCVSMMAAANSVNFFSSAEGMLFFASASSASAAGDDGDVSDHSYYMDCERWKVRLDTADLRRSRKAHRA